MRESLVLVSRDVLWSYGEEALTGDELAILLAEISLDRPSCDPLVEKVKRICASISQG